MLEIQSVKLILNFTKDGQEYTIEQKLTDFQNISIKIPPKNIDKNKKFIEKARKIHGDKYDYSKVHYINDKTKVEIICPIHGSFWQTPNTHICKKARCPKCFGKHKFTTEEFIKKSQEVHGNKYDYSKVNYVNSITPVEIICKKHNKSFWQIPTAHYGGQGCPYCYGTHRKTKEEFIEKAKQIHGDRYDYSEVDYINNSTKVKIFCKHCGNYFWQAPTKHINGKQGCPECKQSHGEKTIYQYLKNHNYNFKEQYVIPIDKSINKSGVAKIDFYLPDYNLFIEYNGRQHYMSVDCFGGEDKFKKQKERDKYVRKYAIDNNIELIEIPYIVDNLEECLNYIFNNMDNIKIVKQTLYTQWVDQSTGELFEETREFLDDTIKVPKKTTSRSSKKPKDNDAEPKVYLEDNKIRLNGKAIELTGFEPEQKINILFEKKGKTITPILCLDDKNGNRLTKSFTISCRGSRHDNLAEYGNIFNISEYEGKENYYKLSGDKIIESDLIEIPEEISDPEEDDLDMSTSDEGTEIDFNLDF